MTHNTTVDHKRDHFGDWCRAECTCDWCGPDRMRWQTALDDAANHCATSHHNWAVA